MHKQISIDDWRDGQIHWLQGDGHDGGAFQYERLAIVG